MPLSTISNKRNAECVGTRLPASHDCTVFILTLRTKANMPCE